MDSLQVNENPTEIQFEEIDTGTIDIAELMQEKWNNWEVSSLSPEEKVGWFSKNLIPILFRIETENDRTLSIVVHEELLDALKEALLNASIPSNLLNPEVSPEQIESFQNNFRRSCSTIQTHGIPLETYNIPELANAAPEQIFIQVETMRGIQERFLSSWVESSGLSTTLKNSQGILTPTFSELRLMYFMDQLNEAKRKKASDVMLATAGSIKL